MLWHAQISSGLVASTFTHGAISPAQKLLKVLATVFIDAAAQSAGCTHTEGRQQLLLLSRVSQEPKNHRANLPLKNHEPT